MNRTVLVPVDGSGRAERAIPVAASIAARAAATLRLIHVYSGDHVPGSAEAAERYVRILVDRVAPAVPMVTGDVMRGDILDTLRHESAAEETAWVVMTAGGAGGERQGFGRTAAGLLAAPGAPIVLCGPSVPVPVREGFARTAEAVEMRNIVVALDGSTATESAVPGAVHFARLHAARLTLISVVPEDASRERTIAEYLDALTDRLDGPDLPVSRKLVRSVDTAGALVRAAAEENAGAIAIGRTLIGRDPAATAILVAARQPLLL